MAALWDHIAEVGDVSVVLFGDQGQRQAEGKVKRFQNITNVKNNVAFAII